ncbi:MAG: MBL fold metallo-hydrolase [Oscillospiraceae bacterium]|nr:MBL fold metallo-hydrolase [Oscillospiraceae bacterium]
MVDIDQSGNGRRVREVFGNIFRIPVVLPNNPLRELNSYLIRDAERSLLIDTGFRIPACKDALLAGLEELGEDPGDVDILLTHLHADHSGLATDIVGNSGRIFIGEHDGALLGKLPVPVGRWVWSDGRDTLTGIPPEVADEMRKTNPAIIFAPPPGGHYIGVKDGEVLRYGGYSLRCVLTPGHTPGHICLWDESVGLMFTGDHVLFDITPNITSWPIRDDSLGDYIDSLRKVYEYPVKTALPGHRETGDFHARIEDLLKHHEERVAEVEGIVSLNPGLTAYEIAEKMKWRIRAANWDGFPISQKIFAVGESLSHLDHLRRQGAVTRELEHGAYRYRKGLFINEYMEGC